MADISTTVGKQDWFVLPNTTLGMRFTWRSLDEFSPRYLPNQVDGFSNRQLQAQLAFQSVMNGKSEHTYILT